MVGGAFVLLLVLVSSGETQLRIVKVDGNGGGFWTHPTKRMCIYIHTHTLLFKNSDTMGKVKKRKMFELTSTSLVRPREL